MHSGARPGWADAQAKRGLLLGEAPYVCEIQGLSVAIWEILQRPAHPTRQVRANLWGVRWWRGELVRELKRLVSSRAVVVHHGVARDGSCPRVHSPDIPNLMDALVHAHEDVLGHVVGVGVAGDAAAHEGPHVLTQRVAHHGVHGRTPSMVALTIQSAAFVPGIHVEMKLADSSLGAIRTS